MKKLNELSPKTKADYSKAAARSLAPSKKYADNYSDAAKASTGKDAKMYQDRSDKNKRDFINRVKGISRANESTDLSQYRKGGSKEGQLPPHLAKFIDPKTGNFTKDAEARIQKGKKSKNFKDVTPKGYGPKESVELDEGIVSKKLTGLVDKGLNKVLDQIEKKTGKHLGFVKKSTVPSAGKDRGNEFVKFKKEAEDFHRKAKKQWTWASKEIEDGFRFYGVKTKHDYRKIPDDKVKFVNSLQAEIQKIIDMHTKLESMMQTTGNSPTYQRTMEKLESDTNRVFKEIADSGIGAIGGKYRAMQGMDNLKKAKKMTHKEPRQTSPAKFRSYANRGESVELDENKATTYLSVYLDHKIMAVHDSKEAGMKYKVGGDGPDGHFLVKTTKSARGVGKFVTRAVGKHLDNQPFPHDDGPHYSVHKESVDEGFMDTMKQLVPGAKGKPAKGKPAKKLNAEQVKISKQIDKKLKLVDSLIQKVKPLGGQISGLMRFSRLPLEKMTPKDLYRVLNDWYKSVEDELDYGNDSVVLSKKYGRSVENLYERMEELALKIKDYMYASGYDVPHGGAKFQNKWLNKVDFSAPKRTDAKWLKMNESVELNEVFGTIGLGFIASTLIKVAATTLMGAIIGGEIGASRKKSAGWTARPRRENSILDLISDKATLKTMQKKYPEALEMIGKNKDIINYSKSITNAKGGPDKEQMQTLKKMIKDEFEKSGISWSDFISSVEPLVRKSVKDAKKKIDENVDVEMIIESVSPKQIAMLKKQYSSMPDRLPLDQAMKMSKMVAKFDKEALMKVAKADIKWISSAAKTNLISKHGATAKDFKESVSEDVPANNTGNVASHGNFPIGHEKLMRRPKLIDVTDKRYTKQTKEGKTVLKSFKSMMKK